ncbi:MAG: glutamate mutase, partial [Alphaproteobacteria bacterium]|nr:glutamate mutase [Alphaproteobacteria bacterium]
KVGERRLAVIGIRDPHTIQLIDKAIQWAKGKVAERFGPIGEGYDVFYHLYGRNAVMKDLDPNPEMKPHELGIVVEAIHRDGDKAAEIAALAARNMFYARLPETKGTAGAAALMSDEILIGEAAYEWTLNHVIEVKNAMELFRTRSMTVDGSGLKEAV